MSSQIEAEAGVPATARRYRLTVRTRLALTYSALLTGAGIVMLSLVYVFMRFVPTYALIPASSVFDEALPAETLPPMMPDTGSHSDPAQITTPAAEIIIGSTEEMLNLLLMISVVVLVVLALVGIAVGWAVAGRMLRPLQYINNAVHRAARGDLQHRIRLAGPRDEISELAANFDDMLAQLDRAFTASKRFASNASHELLTPLATSRAMLDVAMAQNPDPNDHAVFERLRAMNERSIETAQALLNLAQIEASSAPLEEVDLAAIVTEVADFCAAEAGAHGVNIALDLQPVSISAEPVLTRQLVVNLLQNAIRHNVPSGGFVNMTAKANGPDDSVTLAVENSGTPLDPDAVTALSEPFARAQHRPAASTTRGHGLGLSIVASIVARFRGELQFEARVDGGLIVTVSLPGALS